MKIVVCVASLALMSVSFAKDADFENKMPLDAAYALAHPVEVTLFSLNPGGLEKPKGLTLHGYVELGKARLNEEEGKMAANALRRAVDASDGTSAMCFNPRHALRVMTASHTYDFIFCYECLGLAVYRDDKYVADLTIKGNSNALDALLRKSRIPIAGN